MTKALTAEKILLTEFIQLYKEFSCLWDNRDILYTNREARRQAYDVLLEKYRQVQENATIKDIKKRLENLRTCFRREHKRVLLADRNGDNFTPTLWYYHLMTFLIDVMDWDETSLMQDNGDITLKNEFDGESSSSSIKRLLEPPQSDVKNSKMRRLSPIYMQDQQESFFEDDQDIIEEIGTTNGEQDNQNNSGQNYDGATEAIAFGKTVGLQLKELAPMQKIYAEKLISDIIYHGRLNRLTFDSTLHVE